MYNITTLNLSYISYSHTGWHQSNANWDRFYLLYVWTNTNRFVYYVYNTHTHSHQSIFVIICCLYTYSGEPQPDHVFATLKCGLTNTVWQKRADLDLEKRTTQFPQSPPFHQPNNQSPTHRSHASVLNTLYIFVAVCSRYFYPQGRHLFITFLFKNASHTHTCSLPYTNDRFVLYQQGIYNENQKTRNTQMNAKQNTIKIKIKNLNLFLAGAAFKTFMEGN